LANGPRVKTSKGFGSMKVGHAVKGGVGIEPVSEVKTIGQEIGIKDVVGIPLRHQERGCEMQHERPGRPLAPPLPLLVIDRVGHHLRSKFGSMLTSPVPLRLRGARATCDGAPL
jgi:hypothetical protein